MSNNATHITGVLLELWQGTDDTHIVQLARCAGDIYATRYKWRPPSNIRWTAWGEYDGVRTFTDMEPIPIETVTDNLPPDQRGSRISIQKQHTRLPFKQDQTNAI